MVWLAEKGQECQCLVIHCLPDILISSVWTVVVVGGKEGEFGRKVEKAKRGERAKKEEERVGEKEKHKSISKNTQKKQKAQLTLAD